MPAKQPVGVRDMWYGIEQYVTLVAIVSLGVHLLVRRYLLACLAIVVVSSIGNLVHEAWLANFDVIIGVRIVMLGLMLQAFPVIMRFHRAQT